jgi:hypothetical protein
VDGDEHRRTLTRPRKAQRTILIHPAQKGFRTHSIFTTPVGRARLEATKGRIRCRSGYGGPPGLRRD